MASGPGECADSPPTKSTDAGQELTALAATDEGATMGPFRLVVLLGHGGMGAVWLAEQDEPVRRRVALKVVLPGLKSENLTARFAAERQALAQTEHPNIARVLEAGFNAAGRPYIAMELIDGLPLTGHCEKAGADHRDRARLVRDICLGVHHAHQRGIIHRDLKPSNILVPVIDGRAVPKVIDFGLAGPVLEYGVEPAIPVTGWGATREYAAPEQAEPPGAVPDVRADVYSLGVVLYELLTGRLPYPAKADRRTPPRPPKLTWGQGELDHIVLKCLAWEPGDRYESAAALADDLGRLERGEPVRARRSTFWYRARKALQRNRTAAAVAAAVMTALLAGLVIADAQRRRAVGALAEAKAAAGREGEARRLAEQARGRAEQARGRAEQARKLADKESQLAADITRFLNDDLLELGGDDGRSFQGAAGVGPNVTVRRLLSRAEAKLDGRFDARPAVEASVRMTIGRAYRRFGMPAKAVPYLRRSVAMFTEEFGPAAVRTRRALNSLGVALLDQGDYPAAAAALTKALGPAGERAPVTTSLSALALANLAVVRHQSGDAAGAVALLERAAAEAAERFGADSRDCLTIRHNLGVIYKKTGQFDRAVGLLRRVADDQSRVFGPGHSATVLTLTSLGGTYTAAGKPGRAVEVLRPALATARAGLGEAHPSTAEVMVILAGALKRLGRPDEAVPLLGEALRVQGAVMGPTHRDPLTTTVSLGMAQMRAGRLGEAVRLLGQVVPRCEEHLGPDDPTTLLAMDTLGQGQMAAGKFTDAVKTFVKELPRMRKRYGRDNRFTLSCQVRLAGAYWKSGRPDRAIPLFEEVVRAREKALGPDNPATLSAAGDLWINYLDAGRKDDVLRTLGQARRAADKFPVVEWVAGRLMRLDAAAGRKDKVLALAAKAAAHCRRTRPVGNFRAAGLAKVADALSAAGAFAEAEPLLRESYALLASLKGKSRSKRVRDNRAAVARKLAGLYRRAGRSEAARWWAGRAERIAKGEL